MDKESLKPVIESLIFAADSAITFEKIANVLEGEEREAIKAALKELMDDYKTRGGGFFIEELAGGYVFRTNPEFSPWIRRLFKMGLQKISKAAMESLAIIAYKQPVTRAELEAVRGVDSGGVLATLMEKRFIKIVGRKETPGRPVVYGTTKEFLETFDLKDLSCLPSLKDIKKSEEEYAPTEPVKAGSDTAQSPEEPRSGEAAEDNSGRGDNIEAQGRGTDRAGQGDGKQEDGDPAGGKG